MIYDTRNAIEHLCCGPENCGAVTPDDPKKRMCVGNKCMAWRYAKADFEAYDCEDGYCGLAGRPVGAER